ncbi:Epoxide hydrolase-like protein [Kalmanozyma brasiliensis GHG001]|uniref:Epoxide hydrolase n=1 Tax=Kalmanozyma brasiliensis (strain GHG001) TaxID=1365824 RepID=V5ENZ2_KALBG|nr:Epoxide hydrolase-like protein [Kalmanozyma brasiliensis GHG001]EST04643.1 Epoxide hydrolase-like protein [Kalmanozyma brasiliensis GHG001]
MLDVKASRFYTTPLTTPPSKLDATPTQRRYHYLDYRPPAGVPEIATVLLLHGFPDTSSGWRSVIAPLKLAGYRLIIPDLLGYGLTSAPPTSTASAPAGTQPRLAEYGGRAISIDLDGLLDHAQAAKGSEYGAEKLTSDGKKGRVIVLCHDWGSWLGWRFAQWYPDRVMGVCGLCVPFQAPTSKVIPIDSVIKNVPSFGYQKFFSEERSTKIIEQHLDRFLAIIYMIPGLFSADSANEEEIRDWHLLGKLERLLTMPEFGDIPLKYLGRSILDKEQLEEYITMFRSRGMEGPLSWYRTREINWQEDRELASKTLPASLPALLISPKDDVAVPPALGRTMKKHVPQVEIIEVAGSGHWVQNETPGIVISEFKQWVERSVLPNEKKGGVIGWIKSKL